MNGGELEFIAWLRERTRAGSGVVAGPGDDAAVVDWKDGKPCLVTTDMLMDGTCFDLKEAGAYRVGRKAMNVNLSDLAAMAGIPRAAVVSVALPKVGGMALAQTLFLGIESAAREFNCPIVGGDTNSWNGPLVISITLLGVPGPRGPVMRGGAKAGDHLLVTGPLGGSLLGKHLDFKPRVNEALRLAQLADLHAAIDISDGLALDLRRLCGESRCGARLHAGWIPLSAEAGQMADGKTPVEHALGDGEDFELLLAVSPIDASRLLQTQPLEGITLTRVGEILKEGFFLEVNGEDTPLDPAGYSHSLG
ncbi:MAG: thiamine-phosphate kinase [Gemmataceae bacterium]|nr:thiamine-phosphate kinase [Gemmataceae bacterium]